MKTLNILRLRFWSLGVTWRHRIQRYRGFKNFRVTSLTFWDQVTSSVTWSFDSTYVVSYSQSIVTMHLSCTITEIWGPKDIGVMTLTFWGHVTSSVTWPSDSPYGRRHFRTGGQWRPYAYLAWVGRYRASKILGSRVWPFGVMWPLDSTYVVSY